MAIKSYRDSTLTIASGATDSEEVDISADGGAPKSITFWPPSTATGTLTIQLAKKLGGTYAPLDDGFGNVYTLQLGHSQILSGIVGGGLRIHSSGTEASDRAIDVVGVRQQK